MSLVALVTVFVSSAIALFIIVGVYLRKFHSTPSPPTLVVGGDRVSTPPHEVKKPPPNDGSHNASSSTLPSDEVNRPLPDDGSRDAPSSTLQTPTLPMKVYVCTFCFRAFVAFVRAHFCRVHRDRMIPVTRPCIQSAKKVRVRVHQMSLTSRLSQHTS